MSGRLIFGTGAAMAVAGSMWFASENGKVNGSKKVKSPDLIKVNTWGTPKKSFEDAILKSRCIIAQTKEKLGLPGIVVAVSVNGRNVWQEGFGYSDVENQVPCSPQTVMRIASISKSITMMAAAKLYEQELLDLDKPIQHYVPHFPEKTFNGEKVTITTRQLVSHLSGVRHYEKCKASDLKKDDLTAKEYYLKDNFESVAKSLDLFKDDPLIHKPGDKYLYTTHGFTLVSAAIESVVGEPFDKHIVKHFRQLGMNHTCLDAHDKLIPHRSKYYCRNSSGALVNAPYVDNSYKWAGGGFLSTVGDIIRFGNAMLYSYQYIPERYVAEDGSSRLLPGFLSRKTVTELWTGLERTRSDKGDDHLYGMGWVVFKYEPEYGNCKEKRFVVGHSGGAIGASSTLIVLPTDNGTDIPNGIVVAVFTNMIKISLMDQAMEIANIFRDAS